MCTSPLRCAVLYTYSRITTGCASDATIRHDRENYVLAQLSLAPYRSRTRQRERGDSVSLNQRYTWRGAVDSLMIDRPPKKVTVMRGVHTRVRFDLTRSRNGVPGTYKLGSWPIPSCFIRSSPLARKRFCESCAPSRKHLRMRLCLSRYSKK